MLQDNPDMTQREIAEKLGISTSGLNYCLKALIDKGWVKVHNFSQSKNKFGYIYVLTPQGAAEKVLLAGRFLKRKMAEYEAIKAEIDTLTKEGSLIAAEPSPLAAQRADIEIWRALYRLFVRILFGDCLLLHEKSSKLVQ